MKFTANLSLGECRRRITDHQFAAPLLTDTEIETGLLPGNRGQFVVRRVWKAKPPVRNFPVLVLSGTLTPNGTDKTEVIAHQEIQIMGFVVMAAAVVFLLLAFANPRGSAIYWILFIFTAGSFAFDWFILRKIISELKSG